MAYGVGMDVNCLCKLVSMIRLPSVIRTRLKSEGGRAVAILDYENELGLMWEVLEVLCWSVF